MSEHAFIAIFILSHILLTSLAIIGLYGATETDMILQRPADWLFDRLPLWLATPLIGCPPCMASIWGSVSFWIFMPQLELGLMGYLLTWPFFVLSVSGLTKLIYSKITQTP